MTLTGNCHVHSSVSLLTKEGHATLTLESDLEYRLFNLKMVPSKEEQRCVLVELKLTSSYTSCNLTNMNHQFHRRKIRAQKNA
jgi:hypothetical protein